MKRPRAQPFRKLVAQIVDAVARLRGNHEVPAKRSGRWPSLPAPAVFRLHQVDLVDDRIFS